MTCSQLHSFAAISIFPCLKNRKHFLVVAGFSGPHFTPVWAGDGVTHVLTAPKVQAPATRNLHPATISPARARLRISEYAVAVL